MGVKKITDNKNQVENNFSSIYKNISKLIGYYCIIYIVLIFIIFVKDLDIIISFILLFLPLLFKNVMIVTYEQRAQLNLFSKERVDREKNQLEKQVNLYFAMILSIVIELLLIKEGEILLFIIFLLTFLLPLLYFLSTTKRDSQILIEAYKLSEERKICSRIKPKGRMKLK